MQSIITRPKPFCAVVLPYYTLLTRRDRNRSFILQRYSHFMAPPYTLTPIHSFGERDHFPSSFLLPPIYLCVSISSSFVAFTDRLQSKWFSSSPIRSVIFFSLRPYMFESHHQTPILRKKIIQSRTSPTASNIDPFGQTTSLLALHIYNICITSTSATDAILFLSIPRLPIFILFLTFLCFSGLFQERFTR